MSTLPMELRDELGFEIDDYKKPARYKMYNALGHVIVNLLFLKPDTYPSKPYMGINIEQYKFEFIDESTLNEIETKIQDQLNTYIDNTQSINLKLDIIKDNENRKILRLLINVSSNSKSQSFALDLTQDSRTNEVTANFII